MPILDKAGPTQTALLAELTARGPSRTSDLANRLGMRRTAVQQALRRLKRHGIVASGERGWAVQQ